MEDIVYIVEREIIDKLDLSINVLSINANTIHVCNLKWAQVGKVLTAEDGQEYTIINIDYVNNDITFSTPFVSSIGFVFLERPKYKYGTPKTTNVEWSPNELGVTPCIWLVEPLNETFLGNDSSVERESPLRLLLLNSRDAVNWLNKDIHDMRSKQLYSLQDEIIETIEANPIFKKYKDFDSRNLTKLGTESAQGFEKNIIDSDLTALDLRLTLPIYKTSNCIC